MEISCIIGNFYLFWLISLKLASLFEASLIRDLFVFEFAFVFSNFKTFLVHRFSPTTNGEKRVEQKRQSSTRFVSPFPVNRTWPETSRISRLMGHLEVLEKEHEQRFVFEETVNNGTAIPSKLLSNVNVINDEIWAEYFWKKIFCFTVLAN